MYSTFANNMVGIMPAKTTIQPKNFFEEPLYDFKTIVAYKPYYYVFLHESGLQT